MALVSVKPLLPVPFTRAVVAELVPFVDPSVQLWTRAYMKDQFNRADYWLDRADRRRNDWLLFSESGFRENCRHQFGMVEDNNESAEVRRHHDIQSKL